MKIYLAGPMRGYPEFNFPAFHAAAARLRALGHEVWSPAENDVTEDGFNPKTDEPLSMSHYMARDLPAVCRSEAIALLPGWRDSTGAGIEVYVGRKCGKLILCAETLEPIEFEPESICAEADRLVTGARRSTYGHPFDDYSRTAATFNALTGYSLTPADAVTFMLCVKLSRERNAHKRDNLVDLCGYAMCLEMVMNKMQESQLTATT